MAGNPEEGLSMINPFYRGLAACARQLPVRGRKGLAVRSWQRSTPGGWWTVPLGSDTTARLPQGSLQTWIAAFTGGYDDDVIALLLPYFAPGCLALDIGASLGLHTLRLAMHARDSQGYVIAFEPVPANREIIADGLRRNGLTPFAEIRPEALGDRHGTIHLQVEQGGAGNAAVTEGVHPDELARHASAGKNSSAATAQLRPLDSLDLPPQRCSLIKLDVEGCELQVLRGAESLIARDRPVIEGEFNQEWLASRGEDIQWLAEWGRRHRYQFARLSPRRPAWWREGQVGLTPTAGPISGDMVLLPQECTDLGRG
ncbi:MAG: hypothetical protein NVSMB32_14980 [Actinomycetota bacterium]